MCKVSFGDDKEFAKLNFLRYPKGNRDEYYSRTEVKDRMAGLFTKVEAQHDDSIVGKLNNLRDYYNKLHTSEPKSQKKSAKKEEAK